MHLTDSKKAAAESRGITFPAFSTAFLQTLFQPHTAPPLFILACQKQMTNTFVPPSAGVCGSLYKGWWKQRSVIIVFFWGFLRIMCGCIWTVSRIVMGWFLEIIAERTKRALRTPFLRKKTKNRLSRFDTWHFPAPLRRSIFHQAVVSKLVVWVLLDFKKDLKYLSWMNFKCPGFENS